MTTYYRIELDVKDKIPKNINKKLEAYLLKPPVLSSLTIQNRVCHHITLFVKSESNMIESLTEKIIKKLNIPIHHYSILYLGIGDKPLKNLIIELLEMGKLNKQHLKNLFTHPETMKLYKQAFTHKSVSVSNYEFYEIIGDGTLNKAIITFLSKKFPKLNQPKGVEALTPLKHDLISKRSFARLANQLDFWKHIKISLAKRQTDMNRTLEDVFEAFFGVTEILINRYIYDGLGYYICSNIIYKILSQCTINPSYKNVVNPISRLKELFDSYGNLQKKNEKFTKDLNDPLKSFAELKIVDEKFEIYKKHEVIVRKQFPRGLGSYRYDCEKINNEDGTHQKFNVNIYLSNGMKIGSGYAPLKKDAQKRAAENSLVFFKNRGIVKPTPKIFKVY